MKKLFFIFLVMLMIVGCSPNAAPAGDDPKEDVDLVELYGLLQGDKGKWVTAGQYTSESIYVSEVNGKYILHLDQTGDSYNQQGMEIKSCEFDRQKNTYIISYGSNVLNVDASKIDDAIIQAENVYKDNKVFEYRFIPDETAFVVKYILSGKDPSEVNPEYLPYVEFSSDGTFVFTENVYSGMAKIYGNYVEDSGKYTCIITDKTAMQGYAGYDINSFIFYIREANGIELIDDICMSQSGDIFLLEGTVPEKTLLGTYISSTQDASAEYRPCLELYSDGSFIFVENVYEGMVKIYGTFSMHNGKLTCTITDKSNMQGFAGYDLNEFTFNIREDSYELNDEICLSKKGDIFSIDGTVAPKTLLNRYISTTPDAIAAYKPYIELYSDGTFVFRENVYSGLSRIYGNYKEANGMITCNITDKSEMDGYTGYSVETITFSKDSDYGLTLKTTINMSKNGDVFVAETQEKSVSALGTVTVITTDLRIRDSNSTSGKVVGHAEKGRTYPVHTVSSDSQYTWYGIGNNQYIAAKEGEWTLFHYAEDPTVGAELDKRYVISGLGEDYCIMEYLPYVEFYKNGKFVFRENCYSRLARIYGTYTFANGDVVCTITDKKQMDGFKGDDLNKISFYYDTSDPSKIKLSHDICMCEKGNVFTLDQ